MLYGFDRESLEKFIKDVNENIRYSDRTYIELRSKDTKLSVLMNKEDKLELNYNEGGYSYIDFDLVSSFVGSIFIEDIKKLEYKYETYDSIENYHKIHLRDSYIIFEYYCDEDIENLIVKSNEDIEEY